MTTHIASPNAIDQSAPSSFSLGTFKLLAGLGMLTGLSTLGLGYNLLEGSVAATDDLATRLAFGIRWMIFPALAIVLGFQAAGLARFVSPQVDGSSPPEGSTLNLHRRYLQNTLEQFSYFFVVQLALVTLLPANALHLTPIFCVQFLVGRILFWRGYFLNSAWRSFGLTLNYPNLLAVGYVIYRVLTPIVLPASGF